MSKSEQASQMPTKQPESPRALALSTDHSDVEASLAEVRALLEKEKQRLATTERNRAQQPATTTDSPSPDAPHSTHRNAHNTVQNPSDQAQA